MDTAARARELFGEGYFCAEAVLQALAEQLNVNCDGIPAIASGFCSGISRTSGPCGAATGAVMALGLASGRSAPDASDDSRAQMLECYSHVQEFWERFEAACGSVQCSELTGCDFRTPEGLRRFREEKVIERCAEFVFQAASIAGELVEEARETGAADTEA